MKQAFTVTLTLVLSAGLLSGCSQPEETAPQEGVKTVNVETQTLQPASFERHLRLVGTVASRNDVRVSAEVSGRIEEVAVDRGDRVAAGQRIAKIDDSQLLREKQRLEAVTSQSRENYQRLQRLFRQDSVGSEMDYLNARYTYEQNQAALESVEVSLEKTDVRAPFGATVENIFLEQGEMATPGAPLVRLIGSDGLKVVAGVPARFADVVQREDRVEVWFDFQSSDTLELPISFVGQSIDPDARTFNIEVNLPAGGPSWKVDMVANMRLRTLLRDSVLAVGEEFVYQQQGGYVVFVLDTNDEGETVARRRSVQLGSSYENSVILESGVEAGEELITVGSSFLQEGMRVTVVERAQTSMASRN
ncbi:MAG: efflux RND transporter periplasmic adaptor subunit [Balneolaceae bacterium]|nr:efflux RND transporter periplasmic adaptor subunit [Balneolaceae bacterium]